MADTSIDKRDLLSKILDSGIFKGAMGKAPRFARNAESLLKLLQTSLKKTQEMGVGGVFDEIRERVVVLGRMIKAYASGEYRQIELPNLLKIIAGLIYFIAPIDVLPDFLPFIGLSDDIALLIFIMKSIGDEISRFEEWEKNV
jgi:uncharacterized membrane protein YkvA (DUF1232 family)